MGRPLFLVAAVVEAGGGGSYFVSWYILKCNCVADRSPGQIHRSAGKIILEVLLPVRCRWLAKSSLQNPKSTIQSLTYYNKHKVCVAAAYREITEFDCFV